MTGPDPMWLAEQRRLQTAYEADRRERREGLEAFMVGDGQGRHIKVSVDTLSEQEDAAG
jgi:hypothetical protein